MQSAPAYHREERALKASARGFSLHISVSTESSNENAHCGAWEGPRIAARVVGSGGGSSGTLEPARRPPDADAAFSRFGTGCQTLIGFSR